MHTFSLREFLHQFQPGGGYVVVKKVNVACERPLIFFDTLPEPPPLEGAKLGDRVGVEAIVSLYCRNSPGEDLLGKTAGSVFKTENKNKNK